MSDTKDIVLLSGENEGQNAWRTAENLSKPNRTSSNQFTLSKRSYRSVRSSPFWSEQLRHLSMGRSNLQQVSAGHLRKMTEPSTVLLAHPCTSPSVKIV